MAAKKILTQRLLLRRWEEGDAADLFAYAQNPKVGPLAGWRPHRDIVESQAIIRSFRGNDLLWAMCEKESGRVFGSVGFHEDRKRDPGTKSVMLGYAMAESHWGQGYATEACRAVLAYIFKERDIALVSLYHYPQNQRSRRVAQKLGFAYEGTLRGATILYDGTILDDVCYSLLREDFE